MEKIKMFFMTYYLLCILLIYITVGLTLFYFLGLECLLTYAATSTPGIVWLVVMCWIHSRN